MRLIAAHWSRFKFRKPFIVVGGLLSLACIFFYAWSHRPKYEIVVWLVKPTPKFIPRRSDVSRDSRWRTLGDLQSHDFPATRSSVEKLLSDVDPLYTFSADRSEPYRLQVIPNQEYTVPAGKNTLSIKVVENESDRQYWTDKLIQSSKADTASTSKMRAFFDSRMLLIIKSLSIQPTYSMESNGPVFYPSGKCWVMDPTLNFDMNRNGKLVPGNNAIVIFGIYPL